MNNTPEIDYGHIIEILRGGGVGVLPADTIYGLVGCAQEPESVERIYKLKKRDPDKPFIVLVSSIDDLEQFGVVLRRALEKTLSEYWPGPTTIILPTVDEEYSYLYRTSPSIAFRLPNTPSLLSLLEETGPLVAPSANISNMPPASSITEAKKYFGDDVDFYVDSGTIEGKPSRIIDLTSGTPIVIRN